LSDKGGFEEIAKSLTLKTTEVRLQVKRYSFLFFPSFSLFLFLAASVFAQKNPTFAALNDDALTRTPVVGGAKPTAAVNIFELEKLAFALINQKRAAIGLKELTWSDEVAKIARLHSSNMAEYKFFSHRGLDGLMIGDRADSFGLKKWRAIGENIAFNRGYAKPTEFAVERWMESTGHRENLLDDRWKETGVGIAIASDGSYYFTQVFLLRK
jgi:uncharacterized protein YkwD